MRRRLIAGFVGLTVLLVMALAVPLGLLFSHHTWQQARDEVEDRATAIAGALQEHLLVDDLDSFRPGLVSEERVSVIGADGSLWFGAIPDETLDGIIARASSIRVGESRTFSEGGRVTAVVGAGSDGSVESLVVVGRDDDRSEQTVRVAWLVVTGVAVAVVAFAWLIARRLASWIARPLDELRATSSSFGRADLNARVDDRAWPTDLRQLGQSFNEMAGRIERLLALNEAFVHEASHQLRTPLTGLRLRLENLVDGAPEPMVSDLELAADEVARLARLTDGLLALARAERGGAPAQPLELGPFLEERVAQWEPLADEYGISLELGPMSRQRVWSEPDRLSQVIDNLVANALDASPGGTRIAIRTQDGPARTIEVHVVDQGRGMSPEEREHAFERFWRSTGRSDALGGTGLGLPIASRLLVQDGGSLRLDAGAGGVGTDAVITLRPG